MSKQPDADELRPEYCFIPEDFRRGERERYAARFADSDVAGSDLLEEDAAALADEVDRAVWDRVRHRLEER